MPPRDRDLLTYSALTAFAGCARRYEMRYVRHLVPLATSNVLFVGDALHRMAEAWYRGDAVEVPSDVADPWERIRLDEMWRAYVVHWHESQQAHHRVEQTWVTPLRNPATGAASQVFRLAGKIDLIRADDDGLWVWDHKTRSQIDSRELERFWSDLQGKLYVYAARTSWKLDVKGVVYNVFQKCLLRPREGESDAEFSERAASAAARNKSGKTTATQRVAETPDEYRERVLAWYAEAPRFHRERVVVDAPVPGLDETLWQWGQLMLEARRQSRFAPNFSACYSHYGGECPYATACRSDDMAYTLSEMYRKKKSHAELDASVAETKSKEMFI